MPLIRLLLFEIRDNICGLPVGFVQTTVDLYLAGRTHCMSAARRRRRRLLSDRGITEKQCEGRNQNTDPAQKTVHDHGELSDRGYITTASDLFASSSSVG